jgi:flagellar assembly factor FliW
MHTVIEKTPITSEQKTNSSMHLLSTRFGALTVNIDNAFTFEHGPLGLPGKEKFCLVDFLQNQDDQFKLFQCINDPETSFIVIPAAYKNPIIEEDDLDEACEALEIAPEKLLLLFIVSISGAANTNQKQFFVNAKAPILIDISQRTAVQYVFQNPEYNIRHKVA